MVLRNIDNTSVVQRELFEWGMQTHAPGAVKRVEQHERDREDQQEQRRDRYEHTDRPGEDAPDFDQALTEAGSEPPEATNQLPLPGMNDAAAQPVRVPGDFRGRRLDLEA